MAKYTVNVNCLIEVEIPDGLTEDRAVVLVNKQVSELDGAYGAEWDWEYSKPAFALAPEFNPKKPIWVETSRGEWAISGVMMIKKGFELPEGFVMDRPWMPDAPIESIEGVLSQLDSLDRMTEHEGYFNPWVKPLAAMGLKAIGLGIENVAWLVKDGEIAGLVMPCAATDRDIKSGVVVKFRDLAKDLVGASHG